MSVTKEKLKTMSVQLEVIWKYWVIIKLGTKKSIRRANMMRMIELCYLQTIFPSLYLRKTFDIMRQLQTQSVNDTISSVLL